jgi:hypothetical protein
VPVRLTAAFVVLGLLGCLRSFGPNLRARGTHASLPASNPNETCMDCHESEADALARMRAGDVAESPAPLVADWMLTAPQPCAHCHRIRE